MRPKAWFLLLVMLLVVNATFALFGRGWRFESIVVHHSAGRVGDYATIRAMHEARGWTDAAYHLILDNGSTNKAAGILEPTGHFLRLGISGATRDHRVNTRAIHLCVVGDYDQDPFPEELKAPLGHALKALCAEFAIPESAIVFHKDVGNTRCPGANLHKADVLQWMGTLADDLPEPLREQHLRAIDASSLSLSNYPAALLTLQGCASVVVLVVWVMLMRLARKNRPRAARAAARRVSGGAPRGASRMTNRQTPARATQRGSARKNRHK
jgi:hypothetical protein